MLPDTGLFLWINMTSGPELMDDASASTSTISSFNYSLHKCFNYFGLPAGKYYLQMLSK